MTFFNKCFLSEGVCLNPSIPVKNHIRVNKLFQSSINNKLRALVERALPSPHSFLAYSQSETYLQVFGNSTEYVK